jgi:cold shock protein
MLKGKLTGVVKFFNNEKGFGFIRHDDDNAETFVHVSALRDQIKENDRVEFETKDGTKGPNAVNVRLIRQ